MNKNERASDEDDLRPEYDLSKLKGGVRGKYLERYRAGTDLAPGATGSVFGTRERDGHRGTG